MVTRVLLLCLAAMGVASAIEPPSLDTTNPVAPARLVSGTQLDLADAAVKFTLFVPDSFTPTTNASLYVHFHTVASLVIDHHLRAGHVDPLIVFALGSGSAAYRAPFEDTNRFARVLTLVEKELTKRNNDHPVNIGSVHISSFSAGYGAVRELVKTPRYFELIRSIMLLDSLYAGFAPGQGGRTPQADQIDVWVPFARAAVRGEKTFLITTSQVPTPTYANTLECASEMLRRLELKPTPATSAGAFKLQSRTDAAGLHVWSYAGDNANAHMAHVRHLADFWNALTPDRAARRD